MYTRARDERRSGDSKLALLAFLSLTLVCCRGRSADAGLVEPVETATAEPEATEPPPEPEPIASAPVPARIPQAVPRYTDPIRGVYFEANGAALSRAAKRQLDRAVEILLRYPTMRVEVSGHTDSSGYPDESIQLSLQRAEAVIRYLVEHGVQAERLEARGAGMDEPITCCSLNYDYCERANRRVEFMILSQ